MKKYLKAAFFLAFLAPFLVNAQQLTIGKPSWEYGVFGGISNYMGDLAPDPIFKESHPAFGLLLKRNANNYFSYCLDFTVGKISGNDSNSKSLAPRGLNFQSNIYEASFQIEFNFFSFSTVNIRGTQRISPYVFSGLSLFHFDPTSTYNGQTYHLQGLSTEGQGFAEGAPSPYKLTQLAIPLGGGIKFNLSNAFNIAVLAGYRATFTNYLDDVGGVYAPKSQIQEHKGNAAAFFSDPTNYASNSAIPGLQRGNPDRNDWYMFYGIVLSYVVPPPNCPKFTR